MTNGEWVESIDPSGFRVWLRGNWTITEMRNAVAYLVAGYFPTFMYFSADPETLEDAKRLCAQVERERAK